MSEAQLRFKMKSKLNSEDYVRLTGFLDENTGVSIELLPGMDFESMSISPLMIAAESFGYKLSAKIIFRQPIGFDVYENLNLNEEMRDSLSVNRRDFKLSKTIAKPTEVEKNLKVILRTLERVVNQTCSMLEKLVEQTSMLSSEMLDRQLDKLLQKGELKKRGEAPRPFGTIHAKGWKDATERGDGLVPIYMERDKTYLYEDKKVFIYLPRSFVMKILKIGGSVMMPASQFTAEEREVLDKFVMRLYIKTRKIGGKIYYYNLDETTRKLLLNGMKKRRSSLT